MNFSQCRNMRRKDVIRPWHKGTGLLLSLIIFLNGCQSLSISQGPSKKEGAYLEFYVAEETTRGTKYPTVHAELFQDNKKILEHVTPDTGVLSTLRVEPGTYLLRLSGPEISTEGLELIIEKGQTYHITLRRRVWNPLHVFLDLSAACITGAAVAAMAPILLMSGGSYFK